MNVHFWPIKSHMFSLLTWLCGTHRWYWGSVLQVVQKMVVGAVLFDDLLIHGYPDFLGLSCLFTCTSSLDHELSYIFHIKFSACRIICFKYLRKTVVLQTKFVLNNQIINEKKHGCLYPQTFLILPHWISNIYNFLTTWFCSVVDHSRGLPGEGDGREREDRGGDGRDDEDDGQHEQGHGPRQDEQGHDRVRHGQRKDEHDRGNE